jgi:hypothetical protein
MIRTTPTGGSSAVDCCLSPDVIQAISLLHQRQSRATQANTIERFDRALDELVRHPSRSGDPQKLANAAWGNAGKVVRDRSRRVIPYESDQHDWCTPHTDPYEAAAQRYFVSRIRRFLDRAPLPPRCRPILRALADGSEAQDIAAAAGIPVARARVRISQARAQAREKWKAWDC